jgi:hypothetical protein
MTVQELMTELAKLDPNAEVWLEHFEDGPVPVAYVETTEEPRDYAPKGAVFILEGPS